VLMNPIVPGISSKPAILERTVKAIAESGASFVGCNVMFLEGGTRDHFMRWLGDAYPDMVDGYQQLYARKYAPSSYRKEVKRVIGLLRTKYSVNDREPDDRQGSDAPHAVAEQQMIQWRD
jgi:DNA repair photolyase